MKRIMVLILAVTGALAQQPQYTVDKQLVMPANYREWVFLSSGLGMTYGPVAEENRDRPPMFDNVFVTPAAYQAFIKSGKWPEQTTFVLEVRGSVTKESINKDGHSQGDVVAIEVEVKDTARFPGNGWAFFGFNKTPTGKIFPRPAACYSCHSEKAAVDNTFVQFYPTLLPIAKEKGTLSPAYAAASAAGH